MDAVCCFRTCVPVYWGVWGNSYVQHLRYLSFLCVKHWRPSSHCIENILLSGRVILFCATTEHKNPFLHLARKRQDVRDTEKTGKSRVRSSTRLCPTAFNSAASPFWDLILLQMENQRASTSRYHKRLARSYVKHLWMWATTACTQDSGGRMFKDPTMEKTGAFQQGVRGWTEHGVKLGGPEGPGSSRHSEEGLSSWTKGEGFKAQSWGEKGWQGQIWVSYQQYLLEQGKEAQESKRKQGG